MKNQLIEDLGDTIILRLEQINANIEKILDSKNEFKNIEVKKETLDKEV